MACPRPPARGGAARPGSGLASPRPTRALASTGLLRASHGTVGQNPWSQEPPAPDVPPPPVSRRRRQRRGLSSAPGVDCPPRLPALVNPCPKTTKPPAVWRGVRSVGSVAVSGADRGGRNASPDCRDRCELTRSSLGVRSFGGCVGSRETISTR